MAGNINTLFQAAPQGEPPCTLVIVDDQVSILKQIWHKFSAMHAAPDSTPPFRGMTDPAWALQEKIIEQTNPLLTIIYAANGAIAYEIISTLLKTTIEVVLITDQNMPEMRGTELIDKILAIKLIPIAIHTSDKKEELTIPPSVHYISKSRHDMIQSFIEQQCIKKPLTASNEAVSTEASSVVR